jgi:hypothetical protein
MWRDLNTSDALLFIVTVWIFYFLRMVSNLVFKQSISVAQNMYFLYFCQENTCAVLKALLSKIEHLCSLQKNCFYMHIITKWLLVFCEIFPVRQNATFNYTTYDTNCLALLLYWILK